MNIMKAQVFSIKFEKDVEHVRVGWGLSSGGTYRQAGGFW